jgi:Sensors of blue-light using FAD
MTELHEILYCSLMAPDQTAAVVGKIVAQARRRNAERQITGLLVFDGMHFCQHFEGPRREVMALMDAIEHDPRHTQVRVVYEGPLAQRRYQRFDMGFAATEDADEIGRLHQLDDGPALQRFLEMAPRFDVHS